MNPKTSFKDLKKIGWGFGGCNMGCEHCYNASQLVADDCPKFTDLKKVADKLCPQITDINYGTGEFDFNPNALGLARYIRNEYPHIKQAVTTNASTLMLLQPVEIKYLFHDIDISLDYPNAEEHNRFRRHSQAWNWVIESLNILKDLDMERSIVSCVTSRTTDDDIKQLLEISQEFDASWRTNWFRKVGRGKESLRLSTRRFWAIMLFLAKQGVQFDSMSDPLIANLLGHQEKNPFPGCACGKFSCRIQTDLTVTPCVYLGKEKWASGSFLNQSVEDVYNSKHFISIRERYPDFCKNCPFGDTCRGGCASRAVLHNGGLDRPDDFCPYTIMERNEADEMLAEIKSNLKVINGSNKVHDGYLCTMIVKP